MNKKQAIDWYHRITSGESPDRNAALRTLARGSMAEHYWNEPMFTYGIEYGVLIALIEVFDLQPEDLAPPLTMSEIRPKREPMYFDDGSPTTQSTSSHFAPRPE